MKIKDYTDAQLHYTKDDRGDATGAFEMFVAEVPRSMDQEPRSNYSNGLKVNPVADSGKKLNEVIAAYERYRGGRKNPVINFNKFFEMYAEENFADGGSAGQLVQPSGDGSRPGYSGNPKFSSKEFIKKRDVGKDIPKVRNYLDKILKKKDSITFDSIPDIKKKAGLA